MPETEPDHRYVPTSARARRASIVYWVVAALIYISLGVLVPPLFLLGFWQAFLFVLLATFLAPRVLRRFE